MNRISLALMSFIFVLVASCSSVPSTGGESAAALGTKKTQEHSDLRSRIGTWRGTATSVTPEGKETPYPAKEVVSAHGDFFVYSYFETPVSPTPGYRGRGYHGYDAVKGKYVDAWINNATSHLFVKEGHFDSAKNTFVMKWVGPTSSGEIMPQHSEEIRRPNSYTKLFYDNGVLHTRIEMTRVK